MSKLTIRQGTSVAVIKSNIRTCSREPFFAASSIFFRGSDTKYVKGGASKSHRISRSKIRVVLVNLSFLKSVSCSELPRSHVKTVILVSL